MPAANEEVFDLKAATAAVTYCLLAAILIGGVIFIYVETMETDDTSEEAADVDVIGSVGVGSGASPPTGNKGRRSIHRTTGDLITTRKTPRPTTASSPNGAQVAAKLLNASLNWEYAPCRDFYNFVCSRFDEYSSSASKVTLETKAAIKRMLATISVAKCRQRATEKAAGLFKACRRLASNASNSEVKSLRRFASKLGLDMSNMPFDPNFDVLDRIMRLSLEYGFHTFVKFSAIKSHLYRPILSIWAHKADADWMKSKYSQYTRWQLVRVYRAILRRYNQRLDTTAFAARIIGAEVIVESFFANISRNPPLEVVTTVRDLWKYTTGYVSKGDWVSHIRNYTNHTFTADNTVSVVQNATALVVLLLDGARLHRDDSRLLLAWSLLRQLLPFASSQDMVEAMKARGYGTNAYAIYHFCYTIVEKVMPLAASLRYFSNVLPASALASSKQVAMNVRAAQENKINETYWLGDELRRIMLAKSKSLFMIVGYPEGLGNESLVEAFYAGFPDVGKKFFNPFLESHRLVTTLNIRGTLPGAFKTAASRAAYSTHQHVLILWPGLLQPPVFINNAPAAMKYGGLGQVAGHEMMHPFDVSNIEYDSQLQYVQFNDSRPLQIYASKLLCLRASYQRAESESRARTTDDVTDSEGFVDFAGIQLAYAAYRSLPYDERSATVPGLGLNAEQTFFVTHCLKRCTARNGTRRVAGSRYWHGRSRCIVPLRNMPEFARAFSCKPGDPMSPKQTCDFW
ncbi:neprilysin-1-like [Amblyomma americanum]